MMLSNRVILISLWALGWLVGCTAAPTKPAYQVNLDPANFVTEIDNPYYPRLPGSRYVYEGVTAEGVERVVVEVLPETRLVMGVVATVVRDRVTLDGVLIEDTFDWLAQDKAGNVWYFGEAVSDYQDGQLVGHAGSWEAGVDGALPGVIMWADPAAHIGEAYRLEYYRGEAEDMADLLRVDVQVTTPAGSFERVVQTYDYTPLEPQAQEHKFFAPGVGEVKSVNLQTGAETVLVEYVSAEK